MPVELLRTEALSDRAPYAYAARISGGGVVFTAGACPLDAEGRIGPVGDVAGQARLVMDNLVAALASAGARLEDVAKTTVYVATDRREDLLAAWEVVRAVFGEHDAPSTLLAVPLLGYEDQLVEVEAVAVS
ncbi:RidA family protein [Nocardioides panaciterrulae]|uniref:Enamine deaminase RidA (YjgF/YER057c/UK114 family) n=1 Tax=Nocardioides panaciterrulae TaxID=661492 RepID=A0A7Y9JA48_9ACTN|nr:RidA family protein [Nocardioides panaciterrulae]NYD41018.1 enamine deaminase RidA (YjgF/YER057c/UK114 family) [Nocardioides panaciterrulae]